jgi:hypothetical protein
MRVFICVLFATLLSVATADLATLVNSKFSAAFFFVDEFNYAILFHLGQITNYDNCYVIDTQSANDRVVLFWTLDSANNRLSAAVTAANQGTQITTFINKNRLHRSRLE